MEALEPSDNALGDRVRAGDTAAYAQLWSRHVHAGIAAARQFASIADPEDIVSEAHLRILRAMQDGGGPREAFRPYLYRTVRNIALDWRRGAAPTTELSEDIEDSGPDPQDAAESTITVRAFRTLPERWQTVLWYTEVEGMEPAEAAPLLGLSANSAAALAYRAREGLKKAWLQAHVSDMRVPPECRWTTDRMSDYARGTLSSKARMRFDEHLETCTRCSILLEEIDGLSGRLAAILLPATLGGIAGSAFLTQLGDAAPAQAAAPVGQLAAVAAGGSAKAGILVAATAGVIALAAGALVVGSVVAPGAPADPVAAPDVPAAQAPEPTPAPAPAPPAAQPPAGSPPLPQSPAPADPPSAPPAGSTEPAPPAPDTVAPSAPVLATQDGLLTNDPTPRFAGTGEPSATVRLQVLDAEGSPSGGSVVAVVPPSGEWSVVPVDALPDGAYRAVISQVDAAGNASPPASVGFVVDTVTLAPAIDAIEGVQRFLPVLAGTAEPGGTVEVRDDLGALLGVAAVDAGGAWTLPLGDPGRDDQRIHATVTDPAGNVSAATVTEPIGYERPWFANIEDGAVLAADGEFTEVLVHLAGVPGQEVEVFVDGVWTGNIHVLEDEPIARVSPPLTTGEHTIAVRYLDSATGAVGSVAVVRFTLVP